MNIQHLQYILEVQRTGSVSRAAKNLFVSQSGISTSIAGLEAELGFPIFERTRHGMVPTPRGMRVLEHAAKICTSYSDMMGQRIGKKRRINIGGSPHAPFVDAFVELIKEKFEREDLQFCMQSNLGVDTIISMVADGDLDLGVLMTLPSAVANRQRQIQRKGLTVNLWPSIPAAIVIGPGHRLYGQQNIDPEEFAEEAIVDRPACAIVHNSYLQSLVPINRERAILTSDQRAKTELIRCGAAYADSPMFTSENKKGEFRYIPLDDAGFTPILITNPGRSMPPEIVRYEQLLHAKLYNA